MNQVGCTGIMCKIYDFSPLQHGGGGSELQAWLCEIEFKKDLYADSEKIGFEINIGNGYCK